MRTCIIVSALVRHAAIGLASERSRRRLRCAAAAALLGGVAVGVATFDLDGRLRHASRRRMA